MWDPVCFDGKQLFSRKPYFLLLCSGLKVPLIAKLVLLEKKKKVVREMYVSDFFLSHNTVMIKFTFIFKDTKIHTLAL